MAVRVSKADFEEKVLNESLPVLVDFYSDSCVACKKLAPVFCTPHRNRNKNPPEPEAIRSILSLQNLLCLPVLPLFFHLSYIHGVSAVFIVG